MIYEHTYDIPRGLKVEVYYNLRRHCFSVRALEGEHKGHVVAHVHGVHLKDVTFVVQEGGRQRVLAEKRKNVHAFVRGTVTDRGPYGFNDVTYNPYRAGSFLVWNGIVSRPVFRPIEAAATAALWTEGAQRKPRISATQPAYREES